MAQTVLVSARRPARSLRMRSAPVIAFSPIGGRRLISSRVLSRPVVAELSPNLGDGRSQAAAA